MCACVWRAQSGYLAATAVPPVQGPQGGKAGHELQLSIDVTYELLNPKKLQKSEHTRGEGGVDHGCRHVAATCHSTHRGTCAVWRMTPRILQRSKEFIPHPASSQSGSSFCRPPLPAQTAQWHFGRLNTCENMHPMRI